MKKIKFAITLILLIGVFFPATPNTSVTKDLLKEKYGSQLKELTTARDSLRVLYYLFDLADRKDQYKTAWQIYETAGRAEDLNSQMDMLRNLAVMYYKNDSVIDVLQGLADKIPNDEARSSTKTFIFNQQVSYRSGFPEDEKKISALLLDSIVNSHNLQGSDVYDRIALLYQIIQYIGTESEGSLFAECMDKYSELINKLPESDFPLKNQFYTTGAIFHSRLHGDQRRALIYDKKLLEIMDMLQQMYLKQGRTHRTYDTNKFNCYRRMLSNFKVLSDQEIEAIHDSIMMLASRNRDVRREVETFGRTEAYYLYAKGRYRESIPYIKQSLEKEKLTVYLRRKLMYMLMNAAKVTGDQKNYIAGMEGYINDSQIIDSLRGATTARELMIRNSIANAPLLQEESSNKKKHNKSHETTLMTLSGLLGALLIIYIVLYAKLRRKK